MMKSSRLVAFECLHKIFTDNAYSNIELDSVLEKQDSDKPFISALVYGVIERKITLDWHIYQHLKNKPKSKVLTILRIGAFQLLFMDKVPSSAAINESVQLCKEIKQDYYVALVNAVLHKIDDNRQIPDDLSIRYSVPNNLIKMWQKAYSKEVVDEFLPYVNGKPPLFIVPNTTIIRENQLINELKNEGVFAEVSSGVLRVNSPLNVTKSHAFQKGYFHVQDWSSYQCCKALNPLSGETVLDVCAAPGGKSYTMAALMGDRGSVISMDLHENRVKLIKDGAKRLKLNSIESFVNDALLYNENLPMADKILCDVPCSGFGILRRKPEIRYKSLDSIKGLPEIQLKILTVSASYLKQNGCLVYSTCTLNKRENERVVEAFLKTRDDFVLIDEKTTFPTENGGDGFYWALLERK